MIQMEGIENLEDDELQSACRARGMASIGVSKERLQTQLSQWIDLSLNEKVPPSLLLLTRAMYISDNLTPQEQLKSTIAQMPEKLVRKQMPCSLQIQLSIVALERTFVTKSVLFVEQCRQIFCCRYSV